MKKIDAIRSAVEGLDSGEADRAVIGNHPTFGWVWRDWEDDGGRSELREEEEITLSTDYDGEGNLL